MRAMERLESVSKSNLGLESVGQVSFGDILHLPARVVCRERVGRQPMGSRCLLHLRGRWVVIACMRPCTRTFGCERAHPSRSSACCSGSTISAFVAIATDSIATLSWPLRMPVGRGAMGRRLDGIKWNCKRHVLV